VARSSQSTNCSRSSVAPRLATSSICSPSSLVTASSASAAFAAEKDRGFSPAVLAAMLGRFGQLRREEFELDDPSYDTLRGEVDRWRGLTLELARRPWPEPDFGPEL
jgi:hypothetical protein